MNYNKFLTVIRKSRHYIFSLNDVFKYFPKSTNKTIQNQLQSWTNKGLLLRLKNGVYKIQFPEGGPDLPDLYIANKIYEPSYVSLETALSFYSIIPEVAAQVISVTTRQTKLFRNKIGSFKYVSCKNDAYLGYKIINYENFKVYIAEQEKAVVDFIYFKLKYGESIDIAIERFDKKRMKKLSWKKIFDYARKYNNKTLKVLRCIKGKLK